MYFQHFKRGFKQIIHLEKTQTVLRFVPEERHCVGGAVPTRLSSGLYKPSTCQEGHQRYNSGSHLSVNLTRLILAGASDYVICCGCFALGYGQISKEESQVSEEEDGSHGVRPDIEGHICVHGAGWSVPGSP